MKVIKYIFFWVLAFVIFRNINPNGIVFYQGILASIPIAVVYYFLNKKNANYKYEILIFLLITYALNITIITTVDRAYSVKMLMWIEDGGSGKTSQELEQLFSQNFIRAGGITKRTDEQIVSGNIEEDGKGLFTLTKRGEILVKTFHWIKIIFNFN